MTAYIALRIALRIAVWFQISASAKLLSQTSLSL